MLGEMLMDIESLRELKHSSGYGVFLQKDEMEERLVLREAVVGEEEEEEVTERRNVEERREKRR